MKNSIRTLAVAVACGILGLSAGELTQGTCRVSWDAYTLTLQNTCFTRVLKATADGLKTVSFKDSTGAELLANTVGKTAPLTVTAKVARYSVVGAEGISVTAQVGHSTRTYYVFPNVGGPLVDYGSAVDFAVAGPEPTGFREQLTWNRTRANLVRKTGDFLAFATRHLRVTEFILADRTDVQNELEQEKEWLLNTLEAPRFLCANVVDACDTATGNGVVYMRLAPLPRSRPVALPDFVLGGSPYGVGPVANGYPVGELVYTGGVAGRTRALQAFQRALRAYRAGRDGIFLTNTWGDGNRDARINADFLMKEVEAGGELGVDVIQIDDGWQKGRTANSAAVKKGGGTWSTYWDVDPDFWKPCPERFPQGLEPIVAAAKKRGMRFGLWFGPDSSHECQHWEKDAACLLNFHRTLGVDYFKMDSMVIRTGVSAERQRQMFDRMLTESNGTMVFDLDCTANIRPGYLGLVDIGPLFVENRYIRARDGRLYWPHFTLRTAWSLARVIDPVRLRMEVLNPLRLPELYGDDPLAPAHWPADALFAITMCFSPLGWFEISNLSAQTASAWKPLVARWKAERANMHGGVLHTVGGRPDGRVWTGFFIEGADGVSAYALLFRELAGHKKFELDLRDYCARRFSSATVIGGRGKAELEEKGTELEVKVPALRDFVWVKLQ